MQKKAIQYFNFNRTLNSDQKRSLILFLIGTQIFQIHTIEWRVLTRLFRSTCRLFQIAYEGDFRSLCTVTF